MKKLAIVAAAVVALVAVPSAANAKDTQWGGKQHGHHHVLKDTQWGGKHTARDTQWGG